MNLPPPMAPAEREPSPTFFDEGNGYDVFGLHPRALARTLGMGRLLYHHYFRVESLGAYRIPAAGPTIVVANHGGTLPVDAAMLTMDIALRAHPRIPRPIMDRSIPGLPFASTLLARLGAVSGTRTNLRRLLERDELLVVFPEGITGVMKPFRDRYKLQDWRVGHAELAIRHRATIVPAALIGPEEAWPLLARLPLHPFGAPYLPIPATPAPLPVRFHIHYGDPIRVAANPEDADDPTIVCRAALQVRSAVEELLEVGLRARSRDR